jgi:hypothetical protein
VGRVLWYGVILGGIKLRKDAAGREETVHKVLGTSSLPPYCGWHYSLSPELDALWNEV